MIWRSPVRLKLLAALLLWAPLAQSEPDRPPPGTRSLFDYLFSKRVGGRWVYDIPPSFEGLLERLRRIGGGEPLAVLIPMGRSVQRLETDLKDPRIVVTLPGDPKRRYGGEVPPQVKGRLYIGFGRKADQLEVISYNPGAGRFEFQLVNHFSEPARQEVRYAPRTFCKSCHYHGAPIFARNPWEETSAFSATARAIESARGSAAPYHGVPIHLANSIAYEFDRNTDASADLLAYQSLWRAGCGGSADDEQGSAVECRALLAKLAFRTIFDFAIPTESSEYARARELFLRYAQDAFGAEILFPIADLNTRNPLTSSGGFTPDTGSGDVNLGTDDATLDLLRQRTTIPPEFDPLMADLTREDPYIHHPTRGSSQSSRYQFPAYSATLDRPKIRRTSAPETLNELIDWLGSELLLDYDYWERYFDYSDAEPYAKLDRAVDTLAARARQEGGKGVLGNEAFSEDRFLRAMHGILSDSEDEMGICCTGDRDLPEGEAGSGTGQSGGLAENEVRTLSHFAEFCLPCHSANVGSLGFFPGDYSRIDTEVARKILMKLDWEKCRPHMGSPMPPAGAARNAICTEEGQAKRREILETLRERYFADDPRPCGERTRPEPKEWNWLCASH